jgi:hypothetical protein
VARRAPRRSCRARVMILMSARGPTTRPVGSPFYLTRGSPSGPHRDRTGPRNTEKRCQPMTGQVTPELAV